MNRGIRFVGTIFCLVLVFSGCARQALMDTFDTPSGPPLSHWLENEAIPQIINLLKTDSFIKGRPFIIVKAKGEQISSIIDTLTADVRERLTDHILKHHDIKLVLRHPVERTVRHYQLQKIRCDRYTEYELLLTIDIRLVAERRAQARIRILEEKTGRWRGGVSIHKNNLLLNAIQQKMMATTEPDQKLKGLRYQPFQEDEQDLAAAYLARNLSCILKEEYSGGNGFEAFLDVQNTHGDASLIAMLKSQLNFYNQFILTNDRERANWVISVFSKSSGPKSPLQQVWLEARNRKDGVMVKGLTTSAYCRRSIREANDVRTWLQRARLNLKTWPNHLHQGVTQIGANTVFDLTVDFPEGVAMEIEPQKLIVKIGQLKYRFKEVTGGSTFTLRGLSPILADYESGNVQIQLAYEKSFKEVVVQDTNKTVAVDTRMPPNPTLRITKCESNFFTLVWSVPNRDDVAAFIVRHINDDIEPQFWRINSQTMQLTINETPEGKVWVEAVDKAGNVSPSNEENLSCDPVKITAMNILAPIDSGHEGCGSINDRRVDRGDRLHYCYAIEITTDKPARLLLVNVDPCGFGYRLWPTGCKTGRGFDERLRPAIVKRFPAMTNRLYHYIALDDVTGIEDIYAIVITDEYDNIKGNIWCCVQNELCDYIGTGVPSGCHESEVDQGCIIDTAGEYKGSTELKIISPELPGIHRTDGRKNVRNFEEKLRQLAQSHRCKMAWAKRSFIHSGI